MSRLQGLASSPRDSREHVAQPWLGRMRGVHRAAHPRDALPHPRAHRVLAHAVNAPATPRLLKQLRAKAHTIPSVISDKCQSKTGTPERHNNLYLYDNLYQLIEK